MRSALDLTVLNEVHFLDNLVPLVTNPSFSQIICPIVRLVLSPTAYAQSGTIHLSLLPLDLLLYLL